MRQGEVYCLRVSDVDFLRRTLHVRQQVKLLADNRPMLTPLKGGNTREVPLPDTVATELAEHLRKYLPQPDGLVLTSRERRPLTRNSINTRVWKKALRAAGVDPSRTNGMHAAALLRLGPARGRGQHPGRQRVPRPRRPWLHAMHPRTPHAHER